MPRQRSCLALPVAHHGGPAQPPRHSARAYHALVLVLVLMLEGMLIGSARCLTAAWP
jgi:hypothetical protein